jgi:hypothetical protein
MNFGSGLGSGTGFGPGPNIKWNKKVKKKLEANFWETILLLALKRQDYVTHFLLLKNCAK